MWKDDKPGELSDFDYAKINRFVFDGSESVINPLWVAGNCYTLDPRNRQDFLSCADHGPQNLINTFRTITGANKDLYPVCPQYGKLVLAITDCYYPVPYGRIDCGVEYSICHNVINALEEANRYKFDHGSQYKQASCMIRDHVAEWSDYMVRCRRFVVCGMLEDINEAGYGDLVDEILKKYSVKTVDDYKDHKPKRISFEGVNWQDDMELLDEIIYGETPEDKAAAIMAKYADREFYMLEIENCKNELEYRFFIRI